MAAPDTAPTDRPAGPPDPTAVLRTLNPAERQLASVCALLAGARGVDLATGIAAGRVGVMKTAVAALAGLDRARKLRLFARSMTGSSRAARTARPIPPQAHPAMRLFAVRSRTSE